MRLALIAMLATTFSLCERRNPQYCDDSPDFPCDPGSICMMATAAEGGPRCVPTADMSLPQVPCSATLSCPMSQPICNHNTGLCRPCYEGEDALCAGLNPATPRCGGGQCVQCVADGTGSAQAAECAKVVPQGLQQGQAPVCEKTTNQCRPCQLHRECASGVCAKDALYDMPVGSCVPGDQVVVVDPRQCSDNGPIYCTPAQAIALLTPMHRYVVVNQSARDMDFSEINIGDPGFSQFIIGPMADEAPANQNGPPPARIGALGRRGFVIAPRSKVTIEGFYIQGGDTGVECFGSGTTDVETQVRVLRSMLSGNKKALSARYNCHLLMAECWVGKEPDRGIQSVPTGNAQSFDIMQANFDIANTVITGNGDPDNDYVGGIRINGLGDGVNGTSLSTVVNSLFYDQTFAVNSSTTIVCDSTLLAGRLVVLNTMLFQRPTYSSPDLYITPVCNGVYMNLATDEQGLAKTSPSNIYVDRQAAGPGFVNIAKRDFHLIGTPATPQQAQIRTGGAGKLVLGGKTVTAPETDMDGVQRPIGSGGAGKVAIGPYEPPR